MTHSRNCPICRRALGEEEAEKRLRPFCSRRCADVDLGRWLKGNYAIPAVQTDDESEDGAGQSEDQGREGGIPPVRH